jgi:phthalate 4,5-dioxygenase oxygenase subunit
MGQAFRRYWHPVATSDQVAKHDSDPLRVRLLGEALVVFRDSAGRVGVMEELCMHRGSSLAIGRVEGGGIRCLFHGWKFAVDGTILETPNHSDCRLRERLKAPAFPVKEEGGLIWAYIGPKDKTPPFRRFAFMDATPENRTVIRVNVKANYVQLCEGGVDSSHVGVLHSNMARPGWIHNTFERNTDTTNPAALAVDDNAPSLEMEDTGYGFHYAAYRHDSAGKICNIRVVPFMMPYIRIIPAPAQRYTVFETPDNDVSTSTYIVIHGREAVDRGRILELLGLDKAAIYDAATCNFIADWRDRFGQNRSAMRDSWSGLGGVEYEDAVIGLSPGPILDRSKEHLVPADQAVVRMRTLMLQSARKVAAGGDPLGVELSDLRRVSASADAPLGGRWQETAADHFILPEEETA